MRGATTSTTTAHRFERTTGGCSTSSTANPNRITAGILTISAFDREYRGVALEDIVAVDLAPRYEIWRYANIDRPNFTYFLFGNVDQTGPFRYVKGLEDILASNVRIQRINGVRAQYYLELFYYIELGKMGGPYGNRLSELEGLWGGARPPNEGYLEAISVRYATEDTREAQRPKPPAHSDFDDSRKSALSAQLARILVGQDPRLMALAVSSPLWKPVVDDNDLRSSISLAPFSASHTAILRDRDLNEMARVSMVRVGHGGRRFDGGAPPPSRTRTYYRVRRTCRRGTDNRGCRRGGRAARPCALRRWATPAQGRRPA